MKRIIKVTYWLFILWSVLVATLNLNATIAFGHGLGDLYYLSILLLFVVFISIVIFKLPKITNNQISAILLLSFILVIMIVFTLKLTIFRGPEYPWDGNVLI